MSLDVSLHGQTTEEPCSCRECGHEHTKRGTECWFDQNITHNLTEMADEAGLYKPVWRPDENGITHASQLIEPLEKGIALMKADPERFKKFNAKNGWGLYDHLVPWLERYLEACREHPEATVHVSR